MISRREFMSIGGLAAGAAGIGATASLTTGEGMVPGSLPGGILDADPNDVSLQNLLKKLNEMGFVENQQWARLRRSTEGSAVDGSNAGTADYATSAMTAPDNSLAVVTHVVDADTERLRNRSPEALVFTQEPGLPISTWIGTPSGAAQTS